MNSSTSDLIGPAPFGPPLSDRIQLQKVHGSFGAVPGFDYLEALDAIVNAAHAVLAQVLGVINREALQHRLDAIIAFGRIAELSAFKHFNDPSNRVPHAPDFHGALHPAAP